MTSSFATTDLAWDCSAEVKYMLPCSGCSRCCAKSLTETKKPEAGTPQPVRRWWMNYLPRASLGTAQIKREEYFYLFFWLFLYFSLRFFHAVCLSFMDPTWITLSHLIMNYRSLQIQGNPYLCDSSLYGSIH